MPAHPLRLPDRAKRAYTSLVALHAVPAIAGSRPDLKTKKAGLPARKWFERAFKASFEAQQGDIPLSRFDAIMTRALPCPELRAALYQGPEAFLREYQATLGAVYPGMRKAMAEAFSCHYGAAPRAPWILL